MSRRWRYPRVARSTIRWVPPAAQDLPRWQDHAGWRPRWPQLRIHRARFSEPPLVVSVDSAPDFPPAFIRHIPRVVGAISRGARFAPPPDQTYGAPTFRSVRGRAALPIRPGRFWSATDAPSWVPCFTGRDVSRPPAVRRGRFLAVPPEPGVQPPEWVPPQVGARRPRPQPARRGRFTGCPIEQPPAPLFTSTRRAPSPSARRGRFTNPPWSGATPAAAWQLAPARRQRHWRLPRRGRYIEPPWPAISAPRGIRVDVDGPALRGAPAPAGPAVRRLVAGAAASRAVTGAAAVAELVDGPAMHATTPAGPAARREVTGAAASRDVTGIGV